MTGRDLGAQGRGWAIVEICSVSGPEGGDDHLFVGMIQGALLPDVLCAWDE